MNHRGRVQLFGIALGVVLTFTTGLQAQDHDTTVVERTTYAPGFDFDQAAAHLDIYGQGSFHNASWVGNGTVDHINASGHSSLNARLFNRNVNILAEVTNMHRAIYHWDQATVRFELAGNVLHDYSVEVSDAEERESQSVTFAEGSVNVLGFLTIGGKIGGEVTWSHRAQGNSYGVPALPKMNPNAVTIPATARSGASLSLNGTQFVCVGLGNYVGICEEAELVLIRLNAEAYRANSVRKRRALQPGTIYTSCTYDVGADTRNLSIDMLDGKIKVAAKLASQTVLSETLYSWDGFHENLSGGSGTWPVDQSPTILCDYAVPPELGGTGD